jgi:hypothetical protein
MQAGKPATLCMGETCCSRPVLPCIDREPETEPIDPLRLLLANYLEMPVLGKSGGT